MPRAKPLKATPLKAAVIGVGAMGQHHARVYAQMSSTRLVAVADDNAESLKIRLMEYYKKTSPLIGYYHAKGKLRPIDGMGELEEVAAEMAAALDK